MNDKRVYDSDKILSTLRQCILEKPHVDTANMSEEDKEAIEGEMNDDVADMDAQLEENTRQAPADTTEEGEQSTSNEKSKRGFNTDCLINVWKEGKQLIREDNIKETREHKTSRYAREVKLMEAIGDLIKEAQQNKRNTRLNEEVQLEEKPAWLEKCMDVSKFS